MQGNTGGASAQPIHQGVIYPGGLMQPVEKKKLVEKLVDLTVPDTLSESDMSSSIGYELASRMRQRIRQEQIDIRLRHLEPEQIHALLEFYDTAMGRSILESQSKIDRDIAESMSSISADVHHQVIEELQSGILAAKPGGEGEAHN